MTDFGLKVRLTIGPIVSGTKCDKDKLIFPAERWGP